MCRLENLDNMEATRIKFQIPAFLLFREKTTHMLVSKNKACGLKLLVLCYFFTISQLGHPGQGTLTLHISLFIWQ